MQFGTSSTGMEGSKAKVMAKEMVISYELLGPERCVRALQKLEYGILHLPLNIIDIGEAQMRSAIQSVIRQHKAT